MFLLKFAVFIIIEVGWQSSLFSQQTIEPQFETFHGSIVKIPDEYLKIGYSDYVEDLEVEYEIEWDKINVSNRKVKDGFPDVGFQTGWGIIFNTKVSIPKSGFYAFELTSDDGSRLWIDGREIINNDGPHKMRSVADTVLLNQGIYPARIWYYQAYFHLMGLQFESKYIGPSKKYKEINRTITFQNAILFDFARDEIRKDAIHIVDELGEELKSIEHHEVRIIGHTDSIGKDMYNRDLAINRAEAVKNRLQQICGCETLSFYTAGVGETFPRASNDTEEGRQLNRRVEVIINPIE